MRSIALTLLLIGVSQAAQFRSPVYSPAKPAQAPAAPAPLKTEAAAPQMAQAREGTATPADSTSAAQTPAQVSHFFLLIKK